MSILRLMMKLAVLPYGLAFRERRRGLGILIYHRVGGGTDSEIDLPLALFARQMAYLRERHRVISLDDLADGDVRPSDDGGDPVAVTFDDGSRDIYEHAFPVLRRYRIPATVYLVTRYVEEQRPFNFGAYGRRGLRPPPLTWEQVREMVDSGLIGVGSHTWEHADLTRLSPSEIRREVERSHRAIADRLGILPRHFAYPWGLVTPQVRAAVGDRYHTAVRGGCRKNPFGSLDLLALWRRPVQRSDGFRLFQLKMASYLDGEEFLRSWASSRRARGAAPGPA